VVGREGGSDVRLSDTMVSRRHARLNVTDVVEIIDLGSANGISIDDLAVPRTILRAADEVQLGETRLSVRLLHAPGVVPEAGPSVAHVRSPRLDPVYEGSHFEAPELPERPGRQRIPVIAMLAPLLIGGLLFAITKSTTSILFVALTPVMLLGSAIESRIAGRAAYKRAVQDFREDVDGLVAEVTRAVEQEVIVRRGEHPSAAECVDAGRTGSPLLWTRRPNERGFAAVRLGIGRLPSRSSIELPTSKRSTRALFNELVEKVRPLTVVDNVPVVGEFATSAIGIGGPRDHTLPVARALVLQLIGLHSPAEVVLCAVSSSQSARDWDWIKWLPHVSSAASPLTARALCSSSSTGNALLAELQDVVTQRAAARETAESSTVPAVVLIVEDDAPVEHSRLVQLAERGAAVGVHVMWLADELASLPAACRTYVEIGRDGFAGTAGFVHTATAVTPVSLETASAADAADVARRLAPVIDVNARSMDASDLPRSVSLLAVNGGRLASAADAVLERWAESRSLITGPYAPPSPPRHAGTLRAVIGEAAGESFALDLRTDGPHALVGGTTGAGKSELLQAWILALAAAHSPQRLTFLLVDYKGGSAFRDCVDLPHTVGLVTDLTQHLVRRALTSLSAELRYREHVLAQHAAKDLITLEKQGVVDAPPSLVIVVDEFAALVAEVPEFVDGVVNVAQRGRSLGLHLILATQRPAGVIKDNLRANTNLRVALRMADEADSVDVLGVSDAAFFDPSLPGRAVSKTGPGRLVPFQTGYAGGWTTDEPSPPDILVEELGFGSPAVWEMIEDDVVATDPGPTDIRRLVRTIGQANELAGIAAPRKPWLPELKVAYDLSDQDEVPTRRTDAELVFGVRDDPDHQAQPTVAFAPDRDGNLAVYGTGGSGKSTLLRTIAIAAGFTVRGGPCHVYGIDFGARGLAMLEELPHVGSIIAGLDHERIARLLGTLRATIDERAVRFSRVNAATITDYRRLTGATDEPRILLLVDGVSAFRQAYETTDRLKWFDTFAGIAADGRPVGVHVVLSSDQRGGLTTSLASAVQNRVVLRLATQDDYSVLGVPSDILRPSSPPGRGLAGADEVQVAVLGGSPDAVVQAAAVRAFAAAMVRNGAVPAPAIGALPESVRLADLPAVVDGDAVVGVSSTTLGPFGIDPHGSFLISGPPGSGRSTALLTLVTALRRWRPDIELYYFGAPRSALARMDVWRAKAFGLDASDLATTLAGQLPLRRPEDAPVAIVIEGIGDFANGLADNALQELAKVCLAEDHLLVAEGESSTLSSSYGLLGFVKSSRSGLAIQPDQGDGASMYRTNFPRVNPAEFPPGRALSVRLGRVEVVQIATSGDDSAG
jgi:S-DNA-T family DNA segregation ATPase FtsK/SpoIIIE